MATLYFKLRIASKSDFWGCYSLEQALYLGEDKWKRYPRKADWMWLYVTHEGKVVKDWLKEN